MKLDLLALSGIVLGVATIVAGNLLEGGSVGMLLDTPAALIVLGGTLGAVILQTPAAELRRAVRLARRAFTPASTDRDQILRRIEQASRQYRQKGAISLEALAQNERDEFVRNALELVAMEREPAHIRAALELDLSKRVETDVSAAAVYRAMGGYAPTIGILGAVIGLIQVMSHLEDPSQLGPGIATAFVATIYGVGLANLLLLPLAERLRRLVEREADLKALWIDGLLAMVEGEHPSTLRLRIGEGKTLGCFE
ncbi:MAG: flagellar motor protein [Pseudomonadota bacterium]